MYRVKKYVKTIQKNLDKQTETLVNAFKNVENLKFPADAKVLIVVSSMDDLSDEQFEIYLAVNEDMFDSVDAVDDNSEYSDGVYLVDSAILYKEFDTGKQLEQFVDFFEKNDLEEITMKEVSDWVKKCFDLAQVTLPLPIYFRFTDEEDALNLVTGKWEEDQMEIEL
ncbi:hypothetical protein QI30_17030 [Kurthia sp. 3B1D]|uniref:Uncharacterized protein n=1 Tax=Candidatus Kurthia intestinigallinarum TaxID=1562256 RepID=A0A433RPZ0_9BACL|nr:hypothetical protein [Kurthia sp. 3B1D]RUS52466.1 hypothetical protein QI30_17030 [Kurthia sp. 3B1D]